MQDHTWKRQGELKIDFSSMKPVRLVVAAHCLLNMGNDKACTQIKRLSSKSHEPVVQLNGAERDVLYY